MAREDEPKRIGQGDQLDGQRQYPGPKYDGDYMILPIKVVKGVPGTASHSVRFTELVVERGDLE